MMHLLRILLSPFIFIYGLFLICAGMLFPLTMIVFLSLIMIVAHPFIWLINKSINNKIEEMESLLNITSNNFINNLLTVTIPIWGAFYVVYIYIKDGEIFTLN